MLSIQRFVFNIFHENTYLIWNDVTNDAAVIDPGMYDEDEKKAFTKFVENNRLSLKKCINTHCHIDHVLGNSFIKNTFNIPLLIPEKDEFLLNMLNEQAKIFGLSVNEIAKPDEYITENKSIMLGDITGKYISTPGHTPDEYCIYFEQDKILFSGDVLFNQSIGRTDLWGGNQDILLKSIKNKLFTLPDEVRVYPGHDSTTTIGFEKKNNPNVSV